MKTTKKIIQKPIEIDAHIRYKCPKCDNDFWISLAEARTKNFKIVCDCKTVFQPKRIKKLRIIYSSKQQTHVQADQIDHVLKNKCVKALQKYGFEQTEAEDLIIKAYNIYKTQDPLLLIKQAISLIGANNNE